MNDIDPTADALPVFRTKAEQAIEAQFREDIRALLRRLYHDEKLTQEQIAGRLNVTRPTVVDWMKRHGIETAYNRAEAGAS